MLANYVDDQEATVLVLTETNITPSKLPLAHLTGFTLANHCCRPNDSIRGGGGGGVLIFVHNSIPCVKGHGRMVKQKGEMGHCSTTLYPNYNYNQALELVGVYRPPIATSLD